MTAAMEFEAKPTRHECFSAKSIVRPNQRSDMRPFIVSQITRVVVVSAAFRRSDTALSEKIARYRRPLLLPHAVQSGDCLRDRNIGSRGFGPHTSLLQEYPSLLTRFHISQDAGTASYH
jgi:hypothetical protein